MRDLRIAANSHLPVAHEMGLILVQDALSTPGSKQAEEFQRVVRGPGFGPTTDLDTGECWFYPREW